MAKPPSPAEDTAPFLPNAVDREAIARRRLVRVLDNRVVATSRMLEQKISDAGPGPMRVDPHILTPVLRQLVEDGVVARHPDPKTSVPWYHLARTPWHDVRARLDVLLPIHHAIQDRDFLLRLGQALEIAVYRALGQNEGRFVTFLGGYPDLAAHDDSRLYRKVEPPLTLGSRTAAGLVDYVALTKHGPLAIEVKNVREWLYPDRDEIRDLLRKACSLDAVPVLIGRRIPFVTRKLLTSCGALVHETYNQLFPAADVALAANVRDKAKIGFHDVRTGNEPDGRLLRFVGTNMPDLAERVRPTFDRQKDLLAAFGSGEMRYGEFAARVRRRGQGRNEDYDWLEIEAGTEPGEPG